MDRPTCLKEGGAVDESWNFFFFAPRIVWRGETGGGSKDGEDWLDMACLVNARKRRTVRNQHKPRPGSIHSIRYWLQFWAPL